MVFIDYYIERARIGDYEEAFHGLRELDSDALPALQEAYHREDDPMVRSVIVEAIWQYRQASVIGFLADVLGDPMPMVWKQALDGLVTLASPESLSVLRSAAFCERDAGKRAWIEEAIEQSAHAIELR